MQCSIRSKNSIKSQVEDIHCRSEISYDIWLRKVDTAKVTEMKT